MDLFESVRLGDLAGVRELIEQGASVNQTNDNNETVLHVACANEHAEVVSYLLDSGASVGGANTLVAAVRNGHYDCVKHLLKHDADVNCTNADGESPMSVALRLGDRLRQRRCSIILSLLQYGARTSPSLASLALQLVGNAKLEHADAVVKLIDTGIIDLKDDGSFASKVIFVATFCFAFKHGVVDLAKTLLLNDRSEMEQLYPVAAYYSAKHNWSAILSSLLEKGVDANVPTKGKTPLYVACKGHESMVHILLNNGADPNFRTEQWRHFRLPIQIAVHCGNFAVVDMLVRKGAQLELHDVHYPLLHIACSAPDSWKIANGNGVQRSIETSLQMIRLLLKHGVSVNALSDILGETALYRSCASRHGEMVKVQALLEAGADVNLTTPDDRRYPLLAACETGNVELVNRLLNAGANVNSTEFLDQTCLHAAIRFHANASELSETVSDSWSNIVDIIKSLLKFGANVNARCSEHKTALYRAIETGREDIVRVLLEAGADVCGWRRCHPLYAACKHGYIQIVDLLLQRGADVNAPSAPICLAIENGSTEIVSLLLRDKANVNKYDLNGKTALICAVECLTSQSRHVTPVSAQTGFDMMKSLLLAGGDANLPSAESRGLSAFHIASCSGAHDVLLELIQHGADVNRRTKNGETAVDLACENGHQAAVELLLKHGAKPDSKDTTSCHTDNNGYDSYKCAEVALCAAAQDNNESIVKMLLSHEADVNTSGRSGNTALHLATSSTVIETLLRAGASANSLNDRGETALSKFCSQPNISVDIVQMLLTYGADPNIRLPLYDACENNNADIVQLLLEHGSDPNAFKKQCVTVLPIFSYLWIFGGTLGLESKTDFKLSVLCIACKKGNVAMVDNLLKRGATVGFRDSNGNTPLHHAVERLKKSTEKSTDAQAYDQIVALLLQHDAPVNVISDRGETPLYAACGKGLDGVVKQLLDCNADVNLTGINSIKNPLLAACDRKFTDIAIMLLRGGAAANVSRDKQTPLKVAALNGDIELVKELLRREADVNQMSGVDDTALHIAVVPQKGLKTENFAKIVKRLLANGAQPNVANHKYETPLYTACKQAVHNTEVNLEIIQALLEKGADPNPAIPRGSSRWSYDNELPPLTAAVISKNTGLIDVLINYGAKVDFTDKQGRTALHYAIGHDVTMLSKSDHDTSVADMLLSAGAEVNVIDNTGATPLYQACKTGKTELVRFLLSRDADPNSGKLDPIHAACQSQCYEAFKLLIEYNANVSVTDTSARNALRYALEPGNRQNTDNANKYSIVQLLLSKSAIDINVAFSDGKTPLYAACSQGLLSVVDLMLNYGAKVNANIGEKLPLNAACRNKHVPVVQLLLSRGANPNPDVIEVRKDDRHGSTLPLIIAASGGSCEIVELLLRHDAYINAADVDGNTALHRAISDGHNTQYSIESTGANSAKSVIDLLLENKADVNVVNSSFETSLYLATSKGLLDVVTKMLETYGGNPNIFPLAAPHKNPLTAASRTNAQLVDTLLEYGADPNMGRDICDIVVDSNFPLYVAVAENRVEIAKSLLTAGSVMNAVTSNGENVLCRAVGMLKIRLFQHHNAGMEKELMATINVLLEHGAELNALTSYGTSLLNLVVSILAATTSRRVKRTLLQLIRLFLQYGVNLQDSLCNLGDSAIQQRPYVHTLKILARFENEHGILVELFRAGAGFQLLGFCCDAMTQSTRAKSILLCQAAVLAGYKPSAEELQNLQQEVATQRDISGLFGQLLDWLNDDRQRVPSLQRQSRIAIRRHLSTATNFRTILPLIEKLPLPGDLKLYLQFSGPMTDVDLGKIPVQRAWDSETPRELQTQDLISHFLNSVEMDDSVGSDNDQLFCDSDSDSSDSDRGTNYDSDSDARYLHLLMH